MKRYEWSELGVLAKDASHGLITYGDTVEKIKEEIDRSREKQIKAGYPPEVWAIVQKKGFRCFDDKGNFLYEETSMQVIEHYPL